MNSYRYKVTVEALTGARGEPVERPALQFEAANHDDLLAIVERVRAKQMMDADATAAMVIGMKLFAEVALAHRREPMFAEVRVALDEFVQALKAWPAAAAPKAAVAADSDG